MRIANAVMYMIGMDSYYVTFVFFKNEAVGNWQLAFDGRHITMKVIMESWR